MRALGVEGFEARRTLHVDGQNLKAVGVGVDQRQNRHPQRVPQLAQEQPASRHIARSIARATRHSHLDDPTHLQDGRNHQKLSDPNQYPGSNKHLEHSKNRSSYP